MKRLILSSILICSCLSLQADNYKILQLNTNEILIGKAKCKQGDTFSDKDIIVWSSDLQAFKAMNLRTKQIKLFACRAFKKVKAKNIKEYFVKRNNLSTRGVLDFSVLAKELSDTLYVLDNVAIQSPVTIDPFSSYVISYDKGKKWKKLMSTKDCFFINRELFDEENLQKTYTLSLFYREKNKDNYLITDKLNIVILPLRIVE